MELYFRCSLAYRILSSETYRSRNFCLCGSQCHWMIQIGIRFNWIEIKLKSFDWMASRLDEQPIRLRADCGETVIIIVWSQYDAWLANQHGSSGSVITLRANWDRTELLTIQIGRPFSLSKFDSFKSMAMAIGFDEIALLGELPLSPQFHSLGKDSYLSGLSDVAHQLLFLLLR